ncbi:RNA polymerase sigma factor [Streptomyces syringium]|uniref:RNA polymerase sigma factor n=1 Tax=Streptomyces syringium TaxID=76729 RepID=UPI0033DB467E
MSRSYLEPGRVDLRVREDVPLSPEDAGRLARLVGLYDERLRRWARWALEYRRDADAEDVVQNVWVRLSQRMSTLEGGDEALYPLIKAMAKYSLLEVTSNGRRREWAVEDETLVFLAGDTEQDTTVCAVLDLLDGAGEPGWAACYADAIAALPPRQREVLEMRCVDGMTTTAIAARLGVTKQSVQYHLRKALDAMRPAAGAPAETGLPVGYEAVLGRLTAGQQEVIRLKLRGLSDREVERRIGYAQGTVHRAYESAQRSLRRMVREREADPVPASGARSCARQCADGCYLRAADAVPAGAAV